MTPSASPRLGGLAGGLPAAGDAAGRPRRERAGGRTWGRLRRRVLGISPVEVSVARRGFRCDDGEIRGRLEEVGRSFLAGYHAALEDTGAGRLGVALASVPGERRGFAFEGAAMALALLDFFTPWRRGRLQAFLAGPGDAHAYMVYVGAGWALARTPVAVARRAARLDPLLGWLAIDGLGFHAGYFEHRRYVGAQEVPGRLAGYARRVFDQGLGRSLWFVEGTSPGRIAAAVGAFGAERRADLWSGVGLAAAYTGGISGGELESLAGAAEPFAAELAQGAAFAAKARLRAANPAPQTELAARVLCGTSAETAAAVTDRALEGLPAAGTDPAYEVWRRRIRDRFANTGR